MPDADMIPHILATSDVLGTGWYVADAAQVREGGTAVVVGDGAVGLMGVLAASQMGAGRVIVMSRHEERQKLALEYGATVIVEERGEDGIARIMYLTNEVGAESVLECVGMEESIQQAMGACRPGGTAAHRRDQHHGPHPAALRSGDRGPADETQRTHSAQKGL